MLRRILLGILCCCAISAAYSQAEDENNIRELIKVPVPPSPNAAALGKFGEVPVGLSTGIPSISIPIFSWKDDLKELLFNISLSYHAGGHKVEDMPSNVGLGWALNAGGVISRTVRGIPDDGTGGYLNTPTLGIIATNEQNYLSDPPASPINGLTVVNSPTEFWNARYITDRALDGEFDIWNLSAGNISARFFIDKNGEIQFLEKQNVSLSYSFNPLNANFTLVDDRALTYIFDVQESSEAIGMVTIPGQIGNGCASGYYLSKIISADKKDTIFLTYTGFGTIYYEGSFSETYRITYSEANGTFDVPERNYSYSTIHNSTPRVSLIKFPDETEVSFQYNFARADYYGDNALTSVVITNGTATKRFDLSYDYFASDFDPSCGTVMSVNDYSKRLKLTKVTEKSGSDSLPPYTFEYNSQNLPPRNSKAQDHWGYFRGYSGAATSLNPLVSFTPGIMSPPNLGESNRYPQEQYCKASVLERINYPTGGFTRFTYKINDSQTDLYQIASQINNVLLDENGVGNYHSLSLTDRNKDTVKFSVKLFNYLPPPENEPWSEDCAIVITIKSTDNTVTRTINTYYIQALNGVLATLILPLDKTYQVTYETECGWMDDYDVSITYEYWFPPVAKNVGGLRVEIVEDNDSVGNKTITNYTYKMHDGKSSGVLQNLPNYAFYKTFTRIHLSDFWIHYNMASTPSQSLSFFRGSPVVYTRVKVNKSTPSVNIGYSIHEFSPYSMFGFADTYHPYIPTQDLEWLQGLPLRDSIFNSDGQLVKTVRKEYEGFGASGDSAKWRCWVTSLLYNDGDQTLSHYVYAAKSYYMDMGRMELKKNTEVLYTLGDSIKTVTEYTHDPDNFLLTKQKTYNSNGEEVETRMYYPFNYSITTDEKLSSVIAKETYVKQSGTWQLTNGMVNEYATFNSSFVKQKKTIVAELSSKISESTVGAFNPALLVRHSSFKDQVEFLSYDSKGRFTELKSLNKPITSLFWCTTKNYPMAVVENASLANCAYTSFETADLGNWAGIVSADVQNATGVTGSKYYQQTGFSISKSGLTSAMYYTVSYWSKNGAYSITGTQTGYPKTLKTVSSGGSDWTLYEHLVTGQTTITVTGTGGIDELRLYPIGSQMSSFTFKPLAGVSTQCDVNNKLTYYEYDAFGRLIFIRDQDSNILKKIEYKYQQTP